MPDYAKELGAMGGMKAMGGDMMKGGSEESEDDYSSAKEAAASALASALGLDPAGLDLKAVCDAVKQIIELEE